MIYNDQNNTSVRVRVERSIFVIFLSLHQDAAEDIQSIDSCEYIWEAGVGFAQTPPLNYVHDINRWDWTPD